MAAPFEIKVHDDSKAGNKESNFEVETHFLKPTTFTYIDLDNSNQIIESSDFKNSMISNYITVVGEVSPYINNISNIIEIGKTSANKYNISGIRFDNTSNKVTINSLTRVFPAKKTNNEQIISFKLSDFNITKNGSYLVFITTNFGSSNKVLFNVNSFPVR